MSVDDLSQIIANLRLDPLADSQINQQSAQINSVQTKFLQNRINNPNVAKMPEVFKAEYLNCVPTFDGNPTELPNFLSICDTLIQNFYDASTNCFQNTYLLSSLLSKLSGSAKSVVNTQSVSTWDDVKEVLRRSFADQRDEVSLNRDLVMMRQNYSENPQQFFDRVMHVLTLLCSYVDAHEVNDASKKLKREFYNKLALRTYLSGLKDPLGRTLRCMNPKDLTEALQLVIREDNVQYFQNFSNNYSQNNRPVFKSNTFSKTQQNQYFTPHQQTNRFPQYQPFTHTQNNNFRPQNNFPSQPIPVQPTLNQQPQRFLTNSQVFGPRSHNTTNVFKPNPNRTLPRPTPMSLSSRQTQAGPSYSRKNYNYEELHNTEIEHQNYLLPDNFTAEQCAATDENYYYWDDETTSTPYQPETNNEPIENENFYNTPPDDPQK